MSEITDAELQELVFGNRPCGKCDFCIDGQECREGLGTSPTAKRLLERLERVEAEKTKLQTEVEELKAKVSDWQLALHAIVPGFHHDINPPYSLSPKDVAACYKVLTEEQDRLYSLILTQEWSGILGGCSWCKCRDAHSKTCPMFEAKGVVRFGDLPLSDS